MLDVTIVDCDEVIHAKIEDGVKGEKGDKGDQGPPVPLAQELGDDPNLAVSQKLLKDSIDEMESSNEIAVQEAERLNSLSQEAAESADHSAISAESSKQAAELSASQAASSESGAAQSAQDAAQSAVAAGASATQSAQSAAESKDSATQAKNSSDDSAASAQAASESAQAANLSEQNALASEQASDLSAQAAAESESNAKTSEQNAASSAQQSADSAAESERQATLAGEYEMAAKGYSEQASIDADRSESAADRAEEAATLVEDKLDKSAVKDELGDSEEFVINQRKITELYNLVMGWLDIPDSPAYADFTKDRYSMNGKAARFEDLFEFERLSEATTFSEDGLKIWDVDQPRIVRGKGLLIEPESTNEYFGDIFNRFTVYGGASKHKVSGGLNDELFDLIRVDTPDVGTGHFAGRNMGSADLARSAFYKSDKSGSVGTLIIRSNLTELSEDFKRVSSVIPVTGEVSDQVHLLDFRTDGATLNSAYVQGLQLEEIQTTSYIPSEHSSSPVTRLPDLLSLSIPNGYTIKGDWDDTLTIEVVDGKLVHNGIGYIRELKLEKVND